MKRTFASLVLLLGVGCALTAGAGSRMPNDPRARGELAYYSGDPRLAEFEYRAYLAQHPQDHDAVLDLAAVLMDSDQPGAAVRLLQQSGVSGFELGAAAQAAGDLPLAERELKTALRQPGSQWRTRVLLGLLASQTGRQADAVEYYWQALNEDPRQPTVHLLLARALNVLARSSPQAQAYFRQRAREEYQRALKIDPSLWQVHEDLALLAEDEGKYRVAAQEWDEVREILGHRDWIDASQRRLASRLAALATPTAAATPAPTPGPTVAAAPPVPMFVRDRRVEPLSPPDDPVMRVGLAEHLPALTFGCAGPWAAVDANGRRRFQGEGGRAYRLAREHGRWVLRTVAGTLVKRWASRRALFLAPRVATQVLGVGDLYQSSGYFWGGGDRATRYYRGRLELTLQGKQLQLINEVPLEDYLASVVPAEMPPDWPPEALKAQAVAARSDALTRRGTHRRQGFDVCNTPHCAEYGGVTVEDPRTLAAVRATAGQVLRRGDEIVSAFYSHACGGLTQDAEDAWGAGHDPFSPSAAIVDAASDSTNGLRLPLSPQGVRTFLTTTPDVFCADPRYSGKASFRWVKYISREDLQALVGDHAPVGRIKTVQVAERSRSAYVRVLRVVGDRGELRVRGDRIRNWLGGLRSNLFLLIPIPSAGGGDPLAWLAWGGGWGHGVGFCQAGAAAMGAHGYSYADILQHYFPGASLEPLARPTPQPAR